MGEPRGRGYEGDNETNRHVDTSLPEIRGVNGLVQISLMK